MRWMLCIGLIWISAFVAAQIVPYGVDWKYFDLAMAPPNQSGMTWKQATYNDAAWEQGPSELGYGDGDESTVISNTTLTAYYRLSFQVPDPADFNGLSLQLTYDDGAVIYLNGTEIWRVNMPNGNITYNTFASQASSDNALTSTTVANTLVSGDNVLAVEVHQHSATSSDLSFNLTMSGVPAPGVTVITRGPYLQKANASTMVVRWRTNISSPSILDYGTSTSSLTKTEVDMVPKTEHVLLIDSLTPATKYFYQIRNTTDTLMFPSLSVYFKSYPVAGTATQLKAWILGDCGTGTNNARNVRNAFYTYTGTQHTDMILFLGDNAYTDGTDAEYQTAIFQNMYEAKLKNTVAWSCLGNHDGNSANSNTQTGPYYDIFTFPKMAECGGVASGTEAYYSFDYGNIHFVVLDSHESDRSVGGPMYNWCEDDLESTTAYWIIALWHHPAYSKGSHDSDTETALKQMRENFLPLFENNGVDLVLSGHSHSYERTFLLNGHYGISSTFNINSHTVGVTGDGSGQIENNGAYYKAPTGPESGTGAVYITTGSSGKTDSAPLNHPAMYFDGALLGSCVLTINADTLSISFLRQTGAIDDHFTLIKNSACVPGVSCNDNNPCTINDALDNYCYCRGEHRRYVSNANNSGTGSLRDAIITACEGDTILFQASVTDTIRLTSDLDINKDLVIQGTPGQPIVISGQHMTRIFKVTSASDVTLSYMTMYEGNEPVSGGAILNQGNLLLNNVSFTRNWEGPLPKAWTNQGTIVVKSGVTSLRLN